MNRQHRGKGADVSRWFMIGTCVLMILAASAGHAETYIAGQAGFTLAQDTARGRANDPTYAGLPTGTSVSNVNLNNSAMYGVKVGHYFESVSWLGVELEGFVTSPHRPQQRLTLAVPGSGNVTVEEGGATNRLIVVSPLLLARYQAGAFEPYVGVGPGLLLLHQNQLTSAAGGTAYSQSYTGIGLNTQVGLRYRLADHVSMFGEWKFNYARLSLPGQADVGHYGINAVATLHHFVFGIAYHF